MLFKATLFHVSSRYRGLCKYNYTRQTGMRNTTKHVAELYERANRMYWRVTQGNDSELKWNKKTFKKIKWIGPAVSQSQDSTSLLVLFVSLSFLLSGGVFENGVSDIIVWVCVCAGACVDGCFFWLEILLNWCPPTLFIQSDRNLFFPKENGQEYPFVQSWQRDSSQLSISLHRPVT